MTSLSDEECAVLPSCSWTRVHSGSTGFNAVPSPAPTRLSTVLLPGPCSPAFLGLWGPSHHQELQNTASLPRFSSQQACHDAFSYLLLLCLLGNFKAPLPHLARFAPRESHCYIHLIIPLHCTSLGNREISSFIQQN